MLPAAVRRPPRDSWGAAAVDNAATRVCRRTSNADDLTRWGALVAAERTQGVARSRLAAGWPRPARCGAGVDGPAGSLPTGRHRPRSGRVTGSEARSPTGAGCRLSWVSRGEETPRIGGDREAAKRLIFNNKQWLSMVSAAPTSRLGGDCRILAAHAFRSQTGGMKTNARCRRKRCTECRRWFRPSRTTGQSQKTCSPSCRQSRRRKLSRRRRKRDIDGYREDECRRQTDCRERRRSQGGRAEKRAAASRATLSQQKASLSGEIRKSWDTAVEASRATFELEVRKLIEKSSEKWDRLGQESTPVTHHLPLAEPRQLGLWD